MKNEVQKRWVATYRDSFVTERLYRRDPMALHKQKGVSDQSCQSSLAKIFQALYLVTANVFMNELVQIIKKLRIPVTCIQFDSEVAHVRGRNQCTQG